MEYITAREAAEKWGIAIRQVQNLCGQGRVPGAVRFNRSWAIPKDTDKPSDTRFQKLENKKEDGEGILQFAPNKDEFLARVVEDFPYAIALFTTEGTLTYANEAYFKSFFITERMEALGKLNLLRDEITRNSGLTEFASKALKGGTHFLEEQKVPVRDVARITGNGLPPAGIFYKSLVSFPVHDNSGKLAYMATLFLPTREYKGKKEFIKGTEYLENHWRENFDLNAVAKASGLSRAQFVKTFKEHAGMTPYDYYLKIKINHLKEMLLDLNLSVSQAFAACGVDYSGYYAKVFKQYVGETPLQYRKNQR